MTQYQITTYTKTLISSQASGISITKRNLNDSDSTQKVKKLKHANEADNTPGTIRDDEMLSINQINQFDTKQNNDQDSESQDCTEKICLTKKKTIIEKNNKTLIMKVTRYTINYKSKYSCLCHSDFM